jgi:hypothetical protein
LDQPASFADKVIMWGQCRIVSRGALRELDLGYNTLAHELFKIAVHGGAADLRHPLTHPCPYLIGRQVLPTSAQYLQHSAQLFRRALRSSLDYRRSSASDFLTSRGTSTA